MSSTPRSRPILLLLFLLVFIAGCETASPPAGNASQATKNTGQEAKPARDPNAIEQPIAPDAYKVTLALAGAPTLAPDGKSITYQLQVRNEGTAPVYGVGKPDGSMAVNIGGMILGEGEKVEGNGGLRDFVRTPLPLLTPGQSTVVAVKVPADGRLNGRRLRFATVQEAVAWHDKINTIDVGPFAISGDVFSGLPAGN